MIRIGLISILLSIIAGGISYFAVKKNMVEVTKNFAIEDSKRVLISHNQSLNLTPDNLYEHAKDITEGMVGGLFEHAEVYDAHEVLIAESGYSDKMLMKVHPATHKLPSSKEPTANFLSLKNDEWFLIVFLPLKSKINDQEVLIGYIELIRHVPEWRVANTKKMSLKMALMTFGMMLVFATLLYPIIIRLFKSYKTKAVELHTSHILLLEALGRAIAMRDSDTGTHNFRVTYISVMIAEELSMSKVEIQRVILGSFLHDIGKISIPDSILLKKGALTADERKQMEAHVEYGIKIVGNMGWIQDAAIVIGSHHEKWDGSGYPKGLREDQIPLEARVFAVADVFDALCSKRPYKEPFNYRDAMKVMNEGDGKHFDPTVMHAFKSISHQIYNLITSITEADGKELLDQSLKKYFE